MKNLKRLLLSMLLSIALFSCSGFGSKEENAETGIKKKRFEPNIKASTRTAAESGGITLFGSKKNEDLGQNNVLWKATLNTLDFIPLANATYTGGIIVTDWYSSEQSSDKSIKISVTFLSPELSSTSIKVDSFEKSCKENRCKVAKLDSSFSNNIKTKILENARKLKIEQEKKK